MNRQSFPNGYSIEIVDCTDDTTTFRVFCNLYDGVFDGWKLVETRIVNDDTIPAFIAEIEGM